MLNLHIGGKQAHPDWKILNALPGPEVDFVADAVSLSQFEDSSADKIYASHILEHLDYRGAQEGLREWFRVLRQGGVLMVAVPDLVVLSKLFLRADLSLVDMQRITGMIFGGQIDEYDYHKAGYRMETLSYLLRSVGFGTIYRVEQFGIFNDTSLMTFLGEPISLNVIAHKDL